MVDWWVLLESNQPFRFFRAALSPDQVKDPLNDENDQHRTNNPLYVHTGALLTELHPLMVGPVGFEPTVLAFACTGLKVRCLQPLDDGPMILLCC